MNQNLMLTFLKRGFFSSFNEEEMKEVIALFRMKKVKKKTILFHEEEDCQAIYFISQGRVKTFKTDEEGREKIINILGEGEMFPHIGLFGGDQYPASAMVVEDGVLYVIDVNNFLQLLEHNPSLSVKMLKIMEQKIRDLQEHLSGLLSRDISERVWHILQGLAKASGTQIENGIRINMELTHQDLASMVGTTRETITRVLSQFRKENKIEIQNGKFILLD
jgi:CRP/FNR family cyclic AMP-dependent transcriptional regulator